MMTSSTGRSPAGVYPLPSPRTDGPLTRVVAAAALRWRTAFPGWRASAFRAEGEAVAARVGEIAARSRAERQELLRAIRGRLRRDPDDASAHAEALALVGASWTDGLAPSSLEYAAALAVARGRLVEVGGAPDPDRIAMLAAIAAAPWGGGVHLVLRDSERAAALAARLERGCGLLGLSVGLAAPGLAAAERRKAWAADLTCVAIGELVTDALRDLKRLPDRPGDLRLRLENLHGVNPRTGELVQRGLRCAVVLDAAVLLLDEALRTVALSADDGASQELQALALAWDVSAIFSPESGLVEQQSLPAQCGTPAWGLNDAGRARLSEMLAQRGGAWSSPRWREHRISLALLARHTVAAGTHYDADGPGIVPIAPALEALVPDAFERRLLLELLAIRHEREVPRSGTPVASMSIMETFLRYARLGGILPAADRLARRELRALYGLLVLPLAADAPAAVAESQSPSAADRAYMAQARAEHRKVAGRVQKLLAFSGG
jgi:preprotein translocase subunit SecA